MQYGWEGGHLPLSWNQAAETACQCGSKSDLEAFCAVPHLQNGADLSPPALLEAAISGDPTAARTVQEAVQWMARGLHMMSVLVYPDIVTIGGGFMASDWLLEQLRTAVHKETVGYLADSLRPDMIHRAQLGNEAGMIGAAMLANQAFRKGKKGAS
jgi:predicted NBD/HSP70 family sugar kinase